MAISCIADDRCTGEAQNRTIKIDRDELEDAIWEAKKMFFKHLMV